MTGTVVAVNPQRAMVALEADDSYSIIEMLGDDPPELGDRIRWVESTPLGGETVENLTQLCTYDVFSQNHHVPKHQLRGQLRL